MNAVKVFYDELPSKIRHCRRGNIVDQSARQQHPPIKLSPTIAKALARPKWVYEDGCEVAPSFTNNLLEQSYQLMNHRAYKVLTNSSGPKLLPEVKKHLLEWSILMPEIAFHAKLCFQTP